MLYWRNRSFPERHSPLTCLLPSHTLYPSDWARARWISDSGGGGERSPCAPASCQCNVWGRSDPTPTWPADKAVSPAEPRHPRWLEKQGAEDTVAIDYGAGGENLTELQTDSLHLYMHPVFTTALMLMPVLIFPETCCNPRQGKMKSFRDTDAVGNL